MPEGAAAQPHHRFLQGLTALASEPLPFLPDIFGEEYLQAGAHTVGCTALVPAPLVQGHPRGTTKSG